ncbi:histidine phosphatase superfamily [Suillus americanus]|nr:histidine phosphatase superfamily [Suillus americanus]
MVAYGQRSSGPNIERFRTRLQRVGFGSVVLGSSNSFGLCFAFSRVTGKAGVESETVVAEVSTLAVENQLSLSDELEEALGMFAPEVKRMGDQSRGYLGDLTSPSSYPSSARRSLFFRVGAAFFAGFFEHPNGTNTLRPSPSTRFPPCFHPGPTQAGAEPGVAATAPSYPLHSGVVHLVSPTRFIRTTRRRTSIFSVAGESYLRGTPSNVENKFGINSGSEAPDTCNITGVHLLHRHGARYPADYSSGTGSGMFASKLNRNAENVTATGPFHFWTTGEEMQARSTPFGRSQLYDHGVSMHMRYGFLLKNFSETNTLPVFRTASKNRVLNSAQNFALGFFCYPVEGQYQQQIMVEAKGLNNTLAPQRSCANNDDPGRGYRSQPHVNAWKAVYLRDTVPRLQQYLDGFELDAKDIYSMQELCTYESVALGYSKFCEL